MEHGSMILSFFFFFCESLRNRILTNKKPELVIRNCMQITSEKIYTCLISSRGVTSSCNTVITILFNWFSALDHVFHTDAFCIFSRIGMYSRLITFFILVFFDSSAKLVCTVRYIYWPIHFNTIVKGRR